MLNKFILYFNTIKYLKPVQLYGRVFSYITKKTFPLHKPKFPIGANFSIPANFRNSTFLFHDPWNIREKIIDGRFTFLNKEKGLGKELTWRTNSDLLWEFNLHYLQYLHLLDEKEKYNLINSWIGENNFGCGVGWHPYPLSLRIVSLCKNKIIGDSNIKNLYEQAYYLFANLEYYHPGNHYLENAKALLFAGTYLSGFPGSEKWLKKGEEIFLKELPKQVLNDGCYFEKSPMYHNIILHGLLDLLNILEKGSSFYSFVFAYARKMLSFAERTYSRSGDFPLFNDSTHEIAPHYNLLKEYALLIDDSLAPANPNCEIEFFEVSGYLIIKKNNFEFICDAGNIGPDFIPAHAHADLFNYELRIRDLEFVVDSGVFEYKSGEMRNYCRSTKAHNCLTIDGKDQAEMWGSFRIGRRYTPEILQFKDEEGSTSFNTKFEGYGKLIGDYLVHTRSVEYDKILANLSIKDKVTGSKNHLIESYIHLHPEVEIVEKGGMLHLQRREVGVDLSIHGNYEIEEGWYCPEFGRKLRKKVVRIFANDLPAEISYQFNFKSQKN